MATTLSVPVGARGPLTMDEALALIQQRAEEKNGVDSFKVKVHRKAGLGSTPQHVASLEEATINHLANPEQWLPALCGGGPIFILAVCHATETVPNIHFSPPNLNGAEKKVDPLVVKSEGWKGPAVITYPSVSAPVAKTVPDLDLAGISRLLGGSTETPTGSGAREPVSSGAGGAAGLSDVQRAERRLELEAISRGLADIARRNEEAQRKTDERFAALIASLQQQPKVEAKSFAQILADATPAIAALGAIITPIFVGSREAAAKAEERREAEMARSRERAEALQSEMMKLLAAASEKSAAGAADTVKLMGPMVEAVSGMSRNMLQTIATARELQGGEPPEDGLTGVLKAGIAAFAEVYAAKMSNPPVPQQRQLPAAPPKPPPATPGGEPEDGEEEQRVSPEAEAEAQRQWLRTASAEEVLKSTEDAIKSEHDAGELAVAFVEAMTLNPGVAQAVTAAGDPLKLFRSRLGDEWLQAHMGYASALIQALNAAARAKAQQQAQQPA